MHGVVLNVMCSGLYNSSKFSFSLDTSAVNYSSLDVSGTYDASYIYYYDDASDNTYDIYASGTNVLPSIKFIKNTEFMSTVQNFQVCTNCVMDTSDSSITFDRHGVCDHCNTYYDKVLPNWHTNELGKNELDKIIRRIKEDGKNRDFDCIIGVSGGFDSSYLVHLAKQEFNLRPLVFHVDAGWNSDIAVNNIQCLIDGLGLDLFTEVIDWEEMKDLQLAFFKSGVPHVDTPQDHAFFATMYKFASKYGVKNILTGANLSSIDLTGAFLNSADLNSANLSGADLTGAYLIGVKSGGITTIPKKLPTNYKITNGYIIGPGVNLTDVDLSSIVLTDAYF